MEDWKDYDDAYWHYGEDFNTDEVYDHEYDDTGDYEAEFGYYQRMILMDWRRSRLSPSTWRPMMRLLQPTWMLGRDSAT